MYDPVREWLYRIAGRMRSAKAGSIHACLAPIFAALLADDRLAIQSATPAAVRAIAPGRRPGRDAEVAMFDLLTKGGQPI